MRSRPPMCRRSCSTEPKVPKRCCSISPERPYLFLYFCFDSSAHLPGVHMTATTTLFTPAKVGRYTLANRLIMAPMTRRRADVATGVPSDLMPVYYAQRAGAGLIISEGIYPSAMGKGYWGTPGLHTDAQIAGWKKVTAAVHAKGGRIFAQIMHTGRISDPSFLPGNSAPVAPSAVKPNGQSFTAEGMKPHITPRALDTAEIAGIIPEYGKAASRAIEAGF